MVKAISTTHRTQAPVSTEPEVKKVAPKQDSPSTPPAPSLSDSKTNQRALLEKRVEAERKKDEIQAKPIPVASPQQKYTAALAQQQKNDAALQASLGKAKSDQIDEEVRRNTAGLGTSTSANERAVREVKAQLDRARTDPERSAIFERTVRTTLPREETPEQKSTLESRQRFIQNLASETGRDPKLQTIARKTLLEESDLRAQKPSVQALAEKPPRLTSDPSAPRELQNAQVLATSALHRSSPEEQRALLGSISTGQAERLGRTLTTPVEVPSNDPNNPTSSVRRSVLTSSLESLTAGRASDSTRAFTRGVATHIGGHDLPYDRGSPGDDRGPVLDALAKSWGHQVAPSDPSKAGLHEKVLQRGLDPTGNSGQKLGSLNSDQRGAYVNGLLDDPANFAFAHPDAVNLKGDAALRGTVAAETTSRWKELSPQQQREATGQLESLMNARQGQDLLLSEKIPAASRAQYLDLFRRDPGARTDINGALERQTLQVYERSGRTQTQTYPPNALENALGTSLGLPPDASAAKDPSALDQALRSDQRSFYTEGSSEDAVRHLAGRIRETAGSDRPELRMIPIQIASATMGSQSTMVYGVQGKDGKESILDSQGRSYPSCGAWKENNPLPSGTYSYPEGFQVEPGARVVTENTPQTGRQEAWGAADNAALGVGVAGQLVQKVPHPGAVAAGTVGTGLALGYGALRGAHGLEDQLKQGRSLNPIVNPGGTIQNYLNIASGVLPGVVQGSKYLGAVPAIAENPTLAAAVQNIGIRAKVLDTAVGAGQAGLALTYAAQHPDDPGALLNAALSTGFFAPRAFKSGQELKQTLSSVPEQAMMNWEKLSPAERQRAFVEHNPLAQDLNKLTPDEFRTAFGDGPYPEDLAKLATHPGFDRFARGQPERAGELVELAARGRWDPALHMEQHQRSFAQTLEDLRAHTPTESWVNISTKDGSVGYRRTEAPTESRSFPALRLGPWRDLDHNGAFMAPGVVPGGSIQRFAPTSQPRDFVHIRPDQLILESASSGAPERRATDQDWSRIAMFGGHGAPDRFQGLSTPDAARAMASELVRYDSVRGHRPRIEYVVLEACSQGNRRGGAGLWGETNAAEFHRVLNSELARLGLAPVKTLAARDAGPLYGGASHGKFLGGQRPAQFVSPDQQRGTWDGEMIRNRLVLGPGVGVGAAALGSTTYVLVDAIRRGDSSRRKEPSAGVTLEP